MRILTCLKSETAKYTVNELIKYIRLMTDCEVLPEACFADAIPSAPDDDTIFLGLLSNLHLDESDLDDPFIEDIIDLDVNCGNGYICGSNERSILMGVYKYCSLAGCRFIRPGENGEYIPRCDIMNFTAKYRKKADYPFRGECSEGAISYEHMRDTVYWLPKIGMNMYMIEGLVPYTYMHKWYGHVGNRFLREKGQITEYSMLEEYIDKLELDIVKTGIQLHTIGHGWMFEKLGVHHSANSDERAALRDEDKKYLALVNGKRDIYGNSTFYTHFCYSNPDARKILVDFCVDYVKSKPHVDFLHVWLADAANNQCECDECVKMTPSDHYVQLLNEIDEALEGIVSKTRLVFILYVDTVRPPEKLRLCHPERFVLLAAIGSHYEKGYRKTEYSGEIPPFERNNFKAPSNELRLKWHNDWKELCGNIPSIIYEYRFYIDQYCDPGYMRVSRETYRDMKALETVNFQGCMSDQTHRMYMPSSLPLSVMGATLFDKDLDFDSYTDTFLEGSFGEDWKKCKDYLEALSDLFCPGNVRSGGSFGIEEEGLTTKDDYPASWINNPEVAGKTSKIPALLDSFLPVIEKNIILEDPCQRLSWTYLRYHLNICRYLAKIINLGAKGLRDEAVSIANEMEIYVSKIEPAIHNAFDLFLFFRAVRGKLNMPMMSYFD